MPGADSSLIVWRKSSRSSTNGGQCVEVASFNGAVAVRDSKNPDGVKLRIGPIQWEAFTRNIKAGHHAL